MTVCKCVFVYVRLCQTCSHCALRYFVLLYHGAIMQCNFLTIEDLMDLCREKLPSKLASQIKRSGSGWVKVKLTLKAFAK